MKNLIVLIMLAFSFTVNAYEVPSDAIIKVYDKNGKQIGQMTRKEYKVVKLGTSKTVTVTKVVEVPSKVKVKNNQVIVHAGPGKKGLDVDKTNAGYEIEEREAMVFGATYCRKKAGKGICASGFTNSTFTLGVGVDF